MIIKEYLDRGWVILKDILIKGGKSMEKKALNVNSVANISETELGKIQRTRVNLITNII